MNIDEIVVSTRVRLARNFINMPFPKKLKPNDPHIAENFKAIYNVAHEINEKANFYQIDKLSDVDKLALLEKHLISPNLLDNDQSGAVIIVGDYNLSVMLNEEDHLRLQCLIKGYNLDKAYDIANSFDKAIAKKVPYAFDDNYGYLTSCPTNLGTAMRASVMMFLPALSISKKMEDITKVIQNAGLTVRGVYGEGSKSQGYMYQISNQKCLGITCREAIDRVKIVVDSICESEILAAKNLYKTHGVNLEDRIMRAKGLLSYARKLTSAEFMSEISYVKLGIILGMIKGNISQINELIELAQPANLCCLNSKILNGEERDISRAKLVREKM